MLFTHLLKLDHSLTAGILLRSMLFNYYRLKPTELVFSASNHGKPFLASHPGIFFNLTHSEDYVCCSVSNAPVGIDIEQMKPIDILGIASFFSVSEQEYIHSKKTEAKQLEAVYSIWTLKEAFSKQIGLGLSVPLDTYQFILNDEKILLSTQIKNDAQFYSRTIDNHYKFALCSSILSKNIQKQLTLTELVTKVHF